MSNLAVKITIKIKVGKGKEVTLDDAEARELYEALKAHYSKEFVYSPVIIERTPVIPDRWYSVPYRKPWEQDPVIYCGTTCEARLVTN